MAGRRTVTKEKLTPKLIRPGSVESNDENLFGITVEDLTVDNLKEIDNEKGQPSSSQYAEENEGPR